MFEIRYGPPSDKLKIFVKVANISNMMIKNKVLVVLAKYTIVLKADMFGCIVLKALHGLL